jgi:hypothetical protein
MGEARRRSHAGVSWVGRLGPVVRNGGALRFGRLPVSTVGFSVEPVSSPWEVANPSGPH